MPCNITRGRRQVVTTHPTDSQGNRDMVVFPYQIMKEENWFSCQHSSSSENNPIFFLTLKEVKVVNKMPCNIAEYNFHNKLHSENINGNINDICIIWHTTALRPHCISTYILTDVYKTYNKALCCRHEHSVKKSQSQQYLMYYFVLTKQMTKQCMNVCI